jgi:hypothetical protein
METKRDYYEKNVKPVLEALTFQIICEKPESLVSFNKLGKLYGRLVTKDRRLYSQRIKL